MTRTRTMWLGVLLGALTATACGKAPEETTTTVKHSVESLNAVQQALAFVGLWPSYTCGQPRRETATQLAEKVKERFACATVSTEHDDASDTVVLSFPAPCVVDGKTLEGSARLRFSGGNDRLDTAFDLHGLTVDRVQVPLAVSYGECGDSKTMTVAGAGTLKPGTDFAVDVSVSLLEGPPIFGHTTAVIDGSGSLDGCDGHSEVRFDGIEVEVGGALPQAGTVELKTAAGHSARARFFEGWPTTEVKVSVDGSGEVTLPL